MTPSGPAGKRPIAFERRCNVRVRERACFGAPQKGLARPRHPRAAPRSERGLREARLDPLPPFYDDLAACHAELWRCLAEGASGGRSAFHTPALATVDARGRPRLRVVVLREAAAEEGTLRFHCDRRTDKAAEIAATGRAALLAYDAEAKLQIRIEGAAIAHTDDALADAAWAGARAMSRVCYGIAPGPGTALPAGGAYTLPEEDETATIGRENFCAVMVRAERLDFLYLDRRGHRRAQWRRGEGGWTGQWVAP